MHCFLLKTDAKAGEVDQKAALENPLSEVPSEAEVCPPPPCTPVQENEPMQSQPEATNSISAEMHQTVSQPNPTRTPSGRGRPPKTTSSSAQKKVSVKREEETAVQDAPAFQDDLSDADYTPSNYILKVY